MSEQRYADELAWEQAINERYQREFEARAGKAGHGWDTVAGPANTGWTDSGPKKPRPKRQPEPLVGRVAFTVDVEELGRSFYVGDGFICLSDGTTVVSWVADIAGLLYEGRDAQPRSPDAVDPQRVAACRRFKSKMDRLVDFEDEYEYGIDRDSAFSRTTSLEVPQPPGALAAKPTRTIESSDSRRSRSSADQSARQDQVPGTEAPPPSGSPLGIGPTVQPAPPSEHPRASTTPTEREQRHTEHLQSQPRSTIASEGDESSIQQQEEPSPPPHTQGTGTRRAKRLLYEAIEAPKTGPLAPVLSTLQPEQYRLVTWPSDENLVVQGHPGTGKTIVAAHRAAFLVLPKDQADEGQRLDKVALVGPTDRWKAHIAPGVARLVDDGVEVLSLESLVRDWSRGAARTLHPQNEHALHSRWEIGRIVDRAERALNERLPHLDPADKVRELVDSLVQDTQVHQRFVRTTSTDLSDWLLKAGDYHGARQDLTYALFLAAAGIVTGRLGPRSSNQHIVVDEAQDLRPLEWWMLFKMAGAKARWSLFGDMNQRRSDVTWTTWETLADHLELSAVDAEQLPQPTELSYGYRSTREILRFASALLPRGERALSALRSGPEPSVRRIGPNQLAKKVLEEAERLAICYDQGTVAIISSQGQVSKRTKRTLANHGWIRDAASSTWQQTGGSCRISVMSPEDARGLEFDAVLVVEPADFARVDGRHGELYTSLTRANHELVVIHSKAMPKELKGRGNRVRG